MTSREPACMRSRHWTVGISSVALLVLSLLTLAQPGSALAIVTGQVIDEVGNPLEGANVTVEVYDSTMTLRDTLYCDATDEDGVYVVVFGGIASYEPVVGDRIEATATYESEPPVMNFTVIEELGASYSLNVTVDSIMIPEFGFGQGIGLPLAVMGIAAVFAIVARKRRQ